MRQDHALEAGNIVDTASGAGTISVYTNPTPEERKQLIEFLRTDEHTLASALDPDEISRIEHERRQTFVIWKRPNNVSFHALQMFEVSSIGIFLTPDRLTLVQAEETPPFAERKGRLAGSLTDLVLELLLGSVHHYLGHLKVIKLISRELQAKLATSMANEYLLKMFALSESLIYYLNAIEANGAVLAKMRTLSAQLGLTQEQLHLLDDITIENTQCARQTEIYANVLSGLMDARGSIINNNMNVLLKNLTIVNVVFLPLGVLAGIGGMSEFSMMTKDVDWRVAYSLFLMGLVALGVSLWFGLNRWVNRPRRPG
jgi:magnesium transporter